MSKKLAALGIDHFSVAERIDLIAEIWDSIAGKVQQTPLSEAERQEVDRRSDEVGERAGPRLAAPSQLKTPPADITATRYA